MSNELTQRQAEIFGFIAKEITRGLPPTRAEIARKFNIAPNAAEDFIKVLAKKGHLQLLPRVSRGVILTEQGRELLGHQHQGES